MNPESEHDLPQQPQDESLVEAEPVAHEEEHDEVLQDDEQDEPLDDDQDDDDQDDSDQDDAGQDDADQEDEEDELSDDDSFDDDEPSEDDDDEPFEDDDEEDAEPAAAPRRQPAGGGDGRPSAAQLLSSRTERWHQDGQALLSLEDLRGWLNSSGLVLYAPRPAVGAPAPTVVEAVMGFAEEAPTSEQTSSARSLLSRLVADGQAVPLNLMGATGAAGSDVPDFIASASVFSYIFTLRGNKAWKQAPSTSGAVKVSPLALATYEILVEKGMMSSYDLTTQLGKEVTEAAVLRALTELWSQLRVIPVAQQDGSATMWELATSRFTKQIKAGANAGQPSALSALVSLYLGQVMVATEDEICSFLSPLAPRSRVRDVVHALLSARQLETLVIDGKTLLHIGGEQPAFLPAAQSESAGDDSAEADGAPRISKFAGKPGGKLGTGLRVRPAGAGRPQSGGRPAYGSKPAFGAQNRERRPFDRDSRSGGGGTGERPSFNRPRPDRAGGADGAPRFDRPWQDNRRPAAADGAAQGDAPARRPYTPRDGGSARPPRPSFGARPSFNRGPGGDRPAYGGDRPARPSFGDRSDRPARPSFGGGDRPQRPAFGDRPQRSDRPSFGGDRPQFGNRPERSGGFTPRPRPEGGAPAGRDFGDARPPRREFSPRPEGARREGGFNGPREGAGAGPRKTFSKPGTFGRKREGSSGNAGFGAGAEGRPPRRDFGGDARPPRRDFAAGGDSRPPRRDFGSAEGRPPRDFRPAGDGPKRPYTPRPSGGDGAPAKRVFRKFDAPRERRPSSDGPRPEGGRPDRAPRSEGAAGGGFKKPSAFAGKGGPFAKFADGAKPFRKPGQARPKTAGGGFKPVKRSRPEGGR